MRNSLVNRRQAIAALAGASAVPWAHAQAFPSKPIKVVLGVPAGTTQDVLTRAIADSVRLSLGPLVIDNRSGASGRIAADAVKHSEPDGHTLLLGTVAMMTVFLPAFIASRTSIQVISSSHTVFGAGIGDGASAQLYGLLAQFPPPMLRPAAAGGVACAPSDPANSATPAHMRRAHRLMPYLEVGVATFRGDIMGLSRWGVRRVRSRLRLRRLLARRQSPRHYLSGAHSVLTRLQRTDR